MHVSKDTAPSSLSLLLDSPAASIAKSAKFNPRPLAVVILTPGGGALPLPPQVTTTMPSSPSRTTAAAGCPGRPPTAQSSGRLHRRSGTSGSSVGIFPAITVRGDFRKTARCPRCRPHLLWSHASPSRGVPSCSSNPQRSSRLAPCRGSTTCCIPSPPSSTAALGGVAATTIAAPLLLMQCHHTNPSSWNMHPCCGRWGGGAHITKEKYERGEMFSSMEGWEIHRTTWMRCRTGKEKPQLTLHHHSTEAWCPRCCSPRCSTAWQPSVIFWKVWVTRMVGNGRPLMP